jgi:hypothetical protein
MGRGCGRWGCSCSVVLFMREESREEGERRSEERRKEGKKKMGKFSKLENF